MDEMDEIHINEMYNFLFILDLKKKLYAMAKEKLGELDDKTINIMINKNLTYIMIDQ
jgi:hypothetical protein